MNAYRFGPDSTVKLRPMEEVKFRKTPWVKGDDGRSTCNLVANLTKMNPSEVQRMMRLVQND